MATSSSRSFEHRYANQDSVKSPLTAALYSLAHFTSPYPKYVQHHLSAVYATIFGLACITSIGVFVNMKLHFGGILTQVISLGLGIYLSSTNDRAHPLNKSTFLSRGSLLALHAFMIGCSLTPLISHALYIKPSIVMTATLLTASTFVFLSLSALIAQRRAFFALASLLSTSLGLLATYSLLTLFFPSMFSFSIQIYGGLLIFAGFILFNTQLIAERAALCGPEILGTTLFFNDALVLFANLISVFVRILIALMENEKQSNNNKKERRERS